MRSLDWSSLFHRLITPHSIRCRVCGMSADGGGRTIVLRHSVLDGLLCGACFGQIPWITDIHCPICGRGEACPDCVRRANRAFLLSRSAVRYDDTMKAWLGSYKYRGNEALEAVLAGMLQHAFRTLQKDAADCFGRERETILTFVPVTRTRLEERGFNQAERLAYRLGEACRIPVVPLLERTRHTNKQSFKTRQERLGDLDGAFALSKQAAAWTGRRGVSVVLMDDVYTTGTTMQQCAEVLRSGLGPDCQVLGMTWSR